MTEIKEKTSSKLSKKEARKIVYAKFSDALAEYRAGVKDKKFDSNLKKASKLFAADIAKAMGKQKQKLKKPAKIKAVKSDVAIQAASEAAV